MSTADFPMRTIGSPLHPQGTPSATNLAPLRYRITPAPAGNTLQVLLIHMSLQDHPCTRREHFAMESASLSSLGSPLHPQGTPKASGAAYTRPRITPAPAGNTKGINCNNCNNQDHPCTRREHHVAFLWKDNILGSPLHPQGTPII